MWSFSKPRQMQGQDKTFKPRIKSQVQGWDLFKRNSRKIKLFYWENILPLPLARLYTIPTSIAVNYQLCVKVGKILKLIVLTCSTGTAESWPRGFPQSLELQKLA